MSGIKERLLEQAQSVSEYELIGVDRIHTADRNVDWEVYHESLLLTIKAFVAIRNFSLQVRSATFSIDENGTIASLRTSGMSDEYEDPYCQLFVETFEPHIPRLDQ